MLAKHDPTTVERAVIVRVESHGGLLAVFPFAPGVTYDAWLMDAYSSLDGACSVDPGYVRQKTKRAKPDQIATMVRRLTVAGIKPKVLRRIPRTAAEKRERALRERRG